MTVERVHVSATIPEIQSSGKTLVSKEE